MAGFKKKPQSYLELLYLKNENSGLMHFKNV